MIRSISLRTILAAALLAGTAMPAAVQAQAAAPSIAVPPIAYTTRTLPNGLKVYALRDTSSANVNVQMLYDVGSKDDPAGRSGFAHLFEHILSRVTRNIPHSELSRIVEEEAGGTRNASTSADTTRYYETVPANRLETMLWAHAERMGRSVLDQEVFDTERNIVKEEMRQSVLSQPYGRLQRYVLLENGMPGHPYSRSGIGTVGDLDAATLEDARAFHENFYRPDNATLIVSGNFDPAQLDRWIDQHLGTIPRPSRPILRRDMAVQPRTAPAETTAYAPNVPLPGLLQIWQRPKADHPDTPALEVLARILSSGQSSRLYRSLVHERQLAQSTDAFNYSLEDGGMFVFLTVVASGKEPAEAEAALAAEIARLRDQPVGQEELREAITEYVSESLFERETPTGRAGIVASGIINARDPRWEDGILAAIQRVTPADVQRVARQYLRDDRRVAVRYLDEGQRPAGGPAVTDWSQRRTDESLGRTLPAAIGTPNTLAPVAERQAPPAPGPQRPIAPPAFAERRLANGMRVVVARSTDLPLAGAYVVFGGGASADPAARPGVAAMMANLVDDGTPRHNATELATEIERLGAQIGASAGPDSTSAYVAAPAANIDAAGRLLADVVRSPTFAAEELERERRRSLDRIRVSLRQPGFVGGLAMRRALFGSAPYGASTTPEALAAISREDLTAYHANWWWPDNATVVIIGSLSADEGFALAERLFGDWRAPATPLPTLPASRAGQAGAPRVIVIDMPQADQAAVSVALRGATRGDPDYYPLLLANSVLGGSSTGRLFQEVRVKRALSYGAYSSLDTMRDEGTLIAQAQTRNNAAPEVASVMLAEIRRLAAEPVAPDALERRRTLVTGAFGRQVETTFGLGGFLTSLAVQGLPMTDYNNHLARIAAVTPEQIAASVAGELDPTQAHIVIAGRASEFIEALRAQYPNVEVIPLDQFDYGTPALRRAAQ